MGTRHERQHFELWYGIEKGEVGKVDHDQIERNTDQLVAEVSEVGPLEVYHSVVLSQ